MSKGTAQRNFRIDDAIWGPAVARSKAEKIPISAVVRDFLERWGADVTGPIVDKEGAKP